jgi:heme ABC exporter ATP-binding subunit CcmA
LRVTTHRLGKAYGYRWALSEVSVELHPGECVALLGPNGAGKTTFLKILTGLIPPSSGSIDFDGAPSAGFPPTLRGRLGLLAPADHFYENLTVAENLRFFTRLYDKTTTANELATALERVGLAERGDDYAGNLSSGMKCRLSIAKWRLLDPELLLLDEPYGVLDGSGVDLLESFLNERCAKGHIVIMASHHVSRVLELCNRALILHRGRLTFDEAKQNPWPSFDKAFGEFLPRGES